MIWTLLLVLGIIALTAHTALTSNASITRHIINVISNDSAGQLRLRLPGTINDDANV